MADEIYLTQYGLMAEKHWREFRREMEANGTLMEALFAAQETTIEEVETNTPNGKSRSWACIDFSDSE